MNLPVRATIHPVCCALLLALTGCGGGGGGDSGGGDASLAAPPQTPLAYAGSSAAAGISATNSSQLVDNVLGSGQTPGAGPVSAVGSSYSAKGASAGLGEAARALRRTLLGTATSTRRSAVMTIDRTTACDGGSTRLSGTLSDSRLGTLSATYNSCRMGDDTISGPATVRIDAVEYDEISDMTLSFVRLAFAQPGATWELTGSMRLQRIGASREIATHNLIALNKTTGNMLKTVDFVIEEFDDGNFPRFAYRQTLAGKMFDGVHGWVEIATPVSLVFNSDDSKFPVSGQVTLSGAGNGTIRATALSESAVRLELDANGDGMTDNTAVVQWADLPRPAGANLADSDGDGMHDSWEAAHGLNPFNASDADADRDGDGASNRREYWAGSLPSSSSSLPPIARALALAGTTDLVFDPLRGRIYASVSGNPGRVVPIDPVSGNMGTPIAVGIDPKKLALSDDSQYLYVGLEGEPAVERINLSSQTVDLKFPLGTDPDPSRASLVGPWFVNDMQVLPGNPQSIAISARIKGLSPSFAGVAIYDNGVRRPNVTPGHTGASRIEFSASAATLYGYNNESTEYGFRRLKVDAAGVSEVDVFTSFMGDLIQGVGDIQFAGGFIYSDGGRAIDPVSRTVVRRFALPFAGGAIVAADAGIGRVYFVTIDFNSNGPYTIHAFDMNSDTLRASENVGVVANFYVNSVDFAAGSLIRWGSKGLAFRTALGNIYLVESAKLVP